MFRNGLRNKTEFKLLPQISVQLSIYGMCWTNKSDPWRFKRSAANVLVPDTTRHIPRSWSPCLDVSELVWQHDGDLHNILYIYKCVLFICLFNRDNTLGIVTHRTTDVVYIGHVCPMFVYVLRRMYLNVFLYDNEAMMMHKCQPSKSEFPPWLNEWNISETLDEPVSIIIHCNSYTIADIRIANVMHNYMHNIFFSFSTITFLLKISGLLLTSNKFQLNSNHS